MIRRINRSPILKYIFAEFEESFEKDGLSGGWFTAEDFLAELVM
jgi:hypothetical protein